MKKLALFTLVFLSSITSIKAAGKDSHPCVQVAEGLEGCGSKIAENILGNKFKLAPEGILLLFFPFINDLTKYEVNLLRSQIAKLTPQQRKALQVAATLNNGWYTIGSLLTVAKLGSWFCKNDSDKENLAKFMLALYYISQATAAAIARSTYNKVTANYTPTTTVDVINAY